MSWADGRIAAYDCETTGTDPEQARIVTATVAFVGGAQEPDFYSVLVNPGVEIPEGAAEVHGITTERAVADGIPAAAAVPGIVSSLKTAVNAGYPIAIFNARYDLTVLDRECRRHGLAPLENLLVIDPLVIDKHLDRYRRGSRKLDAVCAHHGAVLDQAHDAAADALACARLAWCLAKRGRVIRRVRDERERRELEQLTQEWELARDQLPALHAAQRRWAAEQARGLQEYFDRKGQREHVAVEWPVIPMADQLAA